MIDILLYDEAEFYFMCTCNDALANYLSATFIENLLPYRALYKLEIFITEKIHDKQSVRRVDINIYYVALIVCHACT